MKFNIPNYKKKDVALIVMFCMVVIGFAIFVLLPAMETHCYKIGRRNALNEIYEPESNLGIKCFENSQQRIFSAIISQIETQGYAKLIIGNNQILLAPLSKPPKTKGGDE